MANPLSELGFSDRDYAIAIGTLMGEGLFEGVDGMAAIADTVANRMQAREFRGYGSGFADQALARNAKGQWEFSTWSPSEEDALANAKAGLKAALDKDYASRLDGDRARGFQHAKEALGRTFKTGELRGISQGATFYHNPEVTARLGTGGFHNSLERRYGGVTIGDHRFTGPQLRPDQPFDPISLHGQLTPPEAFPDYIDPQLFGAGIDAPLGLGPVPGVEAGGSLGPPNLGLQLPDVPGPISGLDFYGPELPAPGPYDFGGLDMSGAVAPADFMPPGFMIDQPLPGDYGFSAADVTGAPGLADFGAGIGPSPSLGWDRMVPVMGGPAGEFSDANVGQALTGNNWAYFGLPEGAEAFGPAPSLDARPVDPDRFTRGPAGAGWTNPDSRWDTGSLARSGVVDRKNIGWGTWTEADLYPLAAEHAMRQRAGQIADEMQWQREDEQAEGANILEGARTRGQELPEGTAAGPRGWGAPQTFIPDARDLDTDRGAQGGMVRTPSPPSMDQDLGPPRGMVRDTLRDAGIMPLGAGAGPPNVAPGALPAAFIPPGGWAAPAFDTIGQKENLEPTSFVGPGAPSLLGGAVRGEAGGFTTPQTNFGTFGPGAFGSLAPATVAPAPVLQPGRLALPSPADAPAAPDARERPRDWRDPDRFDRSQPAARIGQTPAAVPMPPPSRPGGGLAGAPPVMPSAPMGDPLAGAPMLADTGPRGFDPSTPIYGGMSSDLFVDAMSNPQFAASAAGALDRSGDFRALPGESTFGGGTPSGGFATAGAGNFGGAPDVTNMENAGLHDTGGARMPGALEKLFRFWIPEIEIPGDVERPSRTPAKDFDVSSLGKFEFGHHPELSFEQNRNYAEQIVGFAPSFPDHPLPSNLQDFVDAYRAEANMPVSELSGKFAGRDLAEQRGAPGLFGGFSLGDIGGRGNVADAVAAGIAATGIDAFGGLYGEPSGGSAGGGGMGGFGGGFGGGAAAGNLGDPSGGIGNSESGGSGGFGQGGTNSDDW